MTFYLFSESAVYCHASYSLVQYYLTALSLECYECTNVPGFSGASACDSNEVTKRTCNKLFDRCMTVTYNLTFLSTSRIVELKNCSNSFACDAGSDFNCKYTLVRIFGFKLVPSDNSTQFLLSLCRPKSMGKNAKKKAKQVSGRELVSVIYEGANRTSRSQSRSQSRSHTNFVCTLSTNFWEKDRLLAAAFFLLT